MKTLRVLCLLCVSLFFSACGTFQSDFQTVANSELAKAAVTAVAQHYGGNQAAELAAAGLSATAEVMQGYVDKKPPLQVAANSPGVRGLSQVVVDYLKKKGWVTQDTVDNIHAAAQLAANATPPATAKDGP